MSERLRFDLFCRVVDNYGDAGVALRLARQLVVEHGLDVTLWIDTQASLARIAPGVDAELVDQRHDGVRIRALNESSAPSAIADVVVETFGCGVPAAYLDAMQAAARPPVWIHLEYLSAEPWIDGAHGLPSPHPQRPLARWFFFPGFTRASGGLIRERDLLAQRDRFRRDTAAQRLHRFDMPSGGEVVTVSLFCYANAALPALFDAWADGDTEIRCIVPEGVAIAALDRFFHGDVPRAGERRRAGRLIVVDVPFVDQTAFDRRLWACDLDIVRGEDSLVRALWAARPFCWHVYPQQEHAHMVKLDALLDRYASGLAAEAALAVRRFWHAFNEQNATELPSAWPPFLDLLPTLEAHGERFSGALAQLPDLASQLVAFARERL